jgi:hypothetical protein
MLRAATVSQGVINIITSSVYQELLLLPLPLLLLLPVLHIVVPPGLNVTKGHVATTDAFAKRPMRLPVGSRSSSNSDSNHLHDSGSAPWRNASQRSSSASRTS